MIAYLTHKEIDKAKWDACIRQSENAIVYAYSWYLDIVSPGWSALVEDNYTTVFPLTHRKKFGFTYLFQPSFTQQLGLFSSQKIKQEYLENFLNVIPADFRLIEIQLNTANLLDLKNKQFEVFSKLTHHLNLNQSKEELYKGFSENLKRNIRKAEKSGIAISREITPDNIITLFQSTRGKELASMKAGDYQILRDICSTAAKKQSVELIGAQSPDAKFIAGAVFLHTDSGYIFLFSGTSQHARETGAMSAVIQHFIESHAGEKKILDFEGSMDPNLARFYKSFGSKEVVYLQIRKNTLPALIRWIKNK